MVVFMVLSESKYDRSQRLLASLNYSERETFEDDSAVSLVASVSKSLHYTFHSGKFYCIEITD